VAVTTVRAIHAAAITGYFSPSKILIVAAARATGDKRGFLSYLDFLWLNVELISISKAAGAAIESPVFINFTPCTAMFIPLLYSMCLQ
jgi:hypothetical protein